MKTFLSCLGLALLVGGPQSAAAENVNIVRWSTGTLVYRNISDGTVTVTPMSGGLDVPAPNGVDLMVIANAAILVSFTDED